MFKIILEAQGENRHAMIESLKDALDAVESGEDEAGGYMFAEYSFTITETEEE